MAGRGRVTLWSSDPLAIIEGETRRSRLDRLVLMGERRTERYRALRASERGGCDEKDDAPEGR